MFILHQMHIDTDHRRRAIALQQQHRLIYIIIIIIIIIRIVHIYLPITLIIKYDKI